MKKKRVLSKSYAILLLCGMMLFGTAGCGNDSAAQGDGGSGNDTISQPDNSSADAGSAVPAGGMEEQQPKDDTPDISIPKGDKYIALTFDDGPTGNTGGRTERLLDGLKQRGVHATFFLCGYRVKDFNSMMNRYLAEGHEVGNHTMDHKLLTTEVSDGGLQQVGSNDDLIQFYTGQKPTMMRPTGGAYNATVQNAMKQLGHPIILWNVDTLDWKYRDATSIMSRIVEGAQDGAIVLEHDLHEATVDGVLAAIDTLQAQGYAFVTVSEMAKCKGVTLEPGVVYTDFTDATLHPETQTSTNANTTTAGTTAIVCN